MMTARQDGRALAKASMRKQLAHARIEPVDHTDAPRQFAKELKDARLMSKASMIAELRAQGLEPVLRRCNDA